MNSTALFAQIKTLLFRLADDIENANSLHLHNDAIHAENFFCELLNLVFLWQLENGNRSKLNQETFDLSDKTNKIFVQITSNQSHRAKFNSVLKDLGKQGAIVKYPEFYLFFISRKVDKPLLERKQIAGTNYEGWDVTKLTEAIFYEKKSAQALQPVFDLLNRELNPLIVNQPQQMKIEAIVLPQQILKPFRKGQFYVDRKTLTDQLFDFTQENNGLITGGPGYGKSFTIIELQRHYQQLGIPCFVIRINELIKGKPEELNRELGTSSRWLNALKQLPAVASRSLLIFDAFDTAKDEAFKTNMLGHIKTAIAELGEHWRIVASTRSYDALKSHRLAELFPHTIKNAIGCRFIEVPSLSETEVLLAVKPHKVLKRAYESANPALKELLRIPYFLKLFEQTAPEKEIINVRTEEQLLTLYWNQRVNLDTSKDIFLRKLTFILSERENLSCKKSVILSEQNIAAYEALLSDGIITETSYTNENLAFAHNILLEYSLFKYVIPDNPEELISYLKVNERQPFLFRSSYIYFYSTLWSHNREQFWTHYLALKKIPEPLFRLVHQTILNYVLAYYFQTVKDLSHINEITNDEERSAILRKIMEAIRFIRPNSLQPKDIQLLFTISEDIAPLSIWELGFLTEKAITQFETDTQRLKILGRISHNYLKYYLEALDNPVLRGRVEDNGRHWAIRNYLHSFAVIEKPKPLINQLLKALKTPDFNINLFYILADEIVSIGKHDLHFALSVYKTIYDYVETSDKETNMNNSVVMALWSNRKQDFNSVYHRLEARFEDLLKLHPKPCLIFGLNIVDEQLLKKDRYWKEREQEALNINEKSALIVEDHSIYDYKTEKDYGPLSHIKRIIKYLHQLAEAMETGQLNDLLVTYIQQARSTTLWVRLLKFLSKHPGINPDLTAGILSNPGIYMFDKTRYHAGCVIQSSWRELTSIQKSAIETAICHIPVLAYEDDTTMERIKAQLYSCVPENELILESSTDLLKKIGKIANEPTSRFGNSTPFKRTIAEDKARLDIRDEMVSEHEAYTLVKLIEEFNDSHLNIQNRQKPVPKDYKPYLQHVKKLYKMRSGAYPAKLLEVCDNEISQYLSVVVRKFKKIPTSLKAWAEEVALYYIDSPIYRHEYQPGELTKNHGAFSPSPRTYATSTFASLLEKDKKPAIGDKMLELMNDNTQYIRFKALKMLPYFYEVNPKQYWSAIEARMLNEKDGYCLHETINAMYFRNVIEESTQKVVDMLWLVNDKLHAAKASDDLEKMFVYLVLDIILNHNNASALDLVKHNSNDENFCREFIWRSFGILDFKNKEKKALLGNKSEQELYALIEDLVRLQFEIIKPLKLSDPVISGPLHTIDLCIQQLFLKVDKEETGRSKQSILKAKKSYLTQIKPLLTLILDESKKIGQGFMLAHSGYYLMQLLYFPLPADPPYILELASDTVTCAAENNFTYDHTTMQETMKLAERILADYKLLLKEKANFNRLISILDHFANSGWLEALELIWKLKEIF